MIGSSVDPSAFTGAGAPVLFQPDATALAPVPPRHMTARESVSVFMTFAH
jgi:hypothetical protein